MKLLTACPPRFAASASLGALLLIFSSSGWATLGDNAASILSDQARMKGTIHSVDNRIYAVHEITATSGAKVREYVTPGGAVFAVAWEGQLPPNLQQLLGPYYQQAKEAQKRAIQKAAQDAERGTPRPRRAPLVIQTPGLVLFEGGNVRNYHGLAYIPQLIPQGVQASDIR